jgi:hypothetical protein
LPQLPEVAPPHKFLIEALRDPSVVLRFDPRQWNDVLAIGFKHWLLGRLGVALEEAGLRHRIPEKARERFDAAAIAIDSSHTAVGYELDRVLRALGEVDTPLVLLKGAAYLMADLPPARGRFIGDLDFLVPRAHIAEVEGKLRARGWAAGELSAYDQRYYREWTHEIPPLCHADRETPVDVHHTIVPLTARYRPDAVALARDAVPLADRRLSVLSPADMVVHGAVHLFNEDSAKPLRDLFDLHDLLCHFGMRNEFWDELLDRARLHGLARPLYYALRHAQRLCGTPVPAAVLSLADAPGRRTGALMDWLFETRMVGEPVSGTTLAGACARVALTVRFHWLRMPPMMLLRHLSVKSGIRVAEMFKRPQADDAA